MKLACALTIAGSDPGGGSGIQADLKTFAALNVHGLSVVASITAQNTSKVQGVFNVPAKFVREQFEAIMDDFEVEWGKTGMLGNEKIIREVRACVEDYDIKLVVDPVMTATVGAPLLEEGSIQELKKFLKFAKLVTPNIQEASELSGLRIENTEDVKIAAKKIAKLGPEWVLIKGGHLATEKIHNILYSEGNFTDFEEVRVSFQDMHGSGCVFSAAIVAELAKGSKIQNAIKQAGDFIGDAIRGKLRIGKGLDLTNPFARVWKISEGSREIRDVQKAAQLLIEDKIFAEHIPEVGTNIVMAKKSAKSREDVIGLSGRIIRVSGTSQITGPPVPGGSEHIANIVLTAMKHDPQIKAGMNLRFSEESIKKCRDLDLQVEKFDRKQEPQNAKTMVWGTKRAIEKAGGVPDVIFDRGAVGKEPMIRILGNSAIEVARLALKIARHQKN